MINTKQEFDKRLVEINIYFDTLDVLDKGRCTISCTDITGNYIAKPIDDALSKILKANGFLLLYNLIEATIRSSIIEILSTIHSHSIQYKNISDKLKILWVNQEFKKLKEDKSLKNKILTFSEEILDDKLLVFKVECVNISGNLDAQEIRKIAKQFGYNESANGRDLVTIKNKRNHLAHGEYTFADIGKDYTVRELVDFKDEVCIYLVDVLNNIEIYINNKEFKK